MDALIFIALVMVIVHTLAAIHRPRPGVIAFGIFWLLCGVYEYYVITGVLCDAKCNIRADLILLIPIQAAALYCAYRSYIGQSGAAKIFSVVVGLVGLLILSFVLEDIGFGFLGLPTVVLVGALAFWLYRRRSRS